MILGSRLGFERFSVNLKYLKRLLPITIMNLPKIIDNQRKNFLDIFRDLAQEHEELSIASGYWDIEGTLLLIEDLAKMRKVRLLLGREPLLKRDNVGNISVPEVDYPDQDFFHDLERIGPRPELKETVVRIKEMIDSGQLEVRVYRKAFLHAKCYIFGGYQSDQAVGIIGSSNFTKNGLTQNTELNALESDLRVVLSRPLTESQEVGHLFWFDELWNDETTEHWDGKFVEILGESPIGDELFSPYEMYIKTLFEIYHEELEDEAVQSTIRGAHELMDFQKKNVQALLRRINKHRVAMLSDSVGLGKTYTAIEVMKQYLDGSEGKMRVEVICPKSLKKQWTQELLTQGVMNFEPRVFQNKGAIEEAQKLDRIASVSLFVIDESHNLRRTSGQRYEQLLAWMRQNPKAHVLLLTATPINNQLSDITNQILLGARGDQDVFKIPLVDHKTKQTSMVSFYQAIQNLEKKIRQDVTRGGTIDYDYVRQTMMPIIRHFVVRRTRQGIEKEYGFLTLDGKKMSFPASVPENQKYDFHPDARKKILALESGFLPLEKIYAATPEAIFNDCKSLLHPLDQLDNVKEFKSTEELASESPMYFIYQMVLMLGFIPYRWRIYQTKFYGKTPEQIKALKLGSEEGRDLQLQMGMYGILRTIFLKRMESSIFAFRTSLEAYDRKLDMFQAGVAKDKIVSLKDMDALEQMLAEEDEDIEHDDAVEADDKLILDTIGANNYAAQELGADMGKERLIIKHLLRQLAIVEADDTKLRSFIELLEKLRKENVAGGKVLVFSYFADTIKYLEKNLPEFTKLITKENSAFVSSKNRESADDLAARFSPNSKNHTIGTGEHELQYLFSTDVLSEGQNLQDCGVIVNYDLHWNPVRMIQRNGRVNRLGSTHSTVYVYNMSPEEKLEGYLRLVGRLQSKIELIRFTIGTDQSVLTELPNPIEYTDSLEDVYSEDSEVRKAAFTKLESSADFLLSEDEYIFDLKKFDKNPENSEGYKQHIYNLPRGKWGVLPSRKHIGSDRPDVLACARLLDRGNPIGMQFAQMEKTGERFAAVTALQALEWIRATSEDGSHDKDQISIDRARIAEITARNIGAYHDEDEPGAPVGQQTEILRTLYELQYSAEDIQSVQAGFGTRNVIDDGKMRKLTRDIIKARRENMPYHEKLKEIIVLAKLTNSEIRPVMTPDTVEGILYYAKDNK